jgi:hypothetical protein
LLNLTLYDTSSELDRDGRNFKFSSDVCRVIQSAAAAAANDPCGCGGVLPSPTDSPTSAPTAAPDRYKLYSRLNAGETEVVVDTPTFTVTLQCIAPVGEGDDYRDGAVVLDIFVSNPGPAPITCVAAGYSESESYFDAYVINPPGLDFPFFYSNRQTNRIDQGGLVCDNGAYIGYDGESVIGNGIPGELDASSGFDCLIGGFINTFQVEV